MEKARQREPSHGAQGRTRTGTAEATRPSNVRVYQFRHLGKGDAAMSLLLLRLRLLLLRCCRRGERRRTSRRRSRGSC